MFHISTLKKYILDASYKISFNELEIQEEISCIEKPMKIVDTKQRVLWMKTIPMVKILSFNDALEEATRVV